MQLKSDVRRRRHARIAQIRRMVSQSKGQMPPRHSVLADQPAHNDQAVRHDQPAYYDQRALYDDRHSHHEHEAHPENTGDQHGPGQKNGSHRRRYRSGQSANDPEEAWKQRMAMWESRYPMGKPYRDGGHQETGGRGRFPAWGGFGISSIVISAVLFIMIWSVYQLPFAWATRVQMVISETMRQTIQTDQVARWYASWFGGSPSWIPIWKPGDDGKAQAVHSGLLAALRAPARGTIVTPFTANGQGTYIWLESDQNVQAAARGRVIFHGHTSSGMTIVIQHPDEVRTVYGWLDETLVEVNEWVEQGDPIARRVQARQPTGEGVLYFSVRKGDEYVDPAEVVSFD